MAFVLGFAVGALATICGLVVMWHLEDRRRDRQALDRAVTRAFKERR